MSKKVRPLPPTLSRPFIEYFRSILILPRGVSDLNSDALLEPPICHAPYYTLLGAMICPRSLTRFPLRSEHRPRFFCVLSRVKVLFPVVFLPTFVPCFQMAMLFESAFFPPPIPGFLGKIYIPPFCGAPPLSKVRFLSKIFTFLCQAFFP